MKTFLLFLLVFLFVCAFPAMAQTTTTCNRAYDAVLYLPLDADANDSSGNGNNGTVSGATLDATGGYNGSGGYIFDGTSLANDSISAAIASGWTSGSGATLIAWVYPTATSSGRSAQQVLDSQSGHFSIVYSSGKDHWDFGHHVTGTISKDSGFYPDLNTWQHIAVVLDPSAGEMRFYKDGGESVQSAAATDLDETTTLLLIGNSISYKNYYFTGTIDEVYLFDTPLTADEIEKIYTGQFDCADGYTCTTAGACEAKDSDGDGVTDNEDAFPNDATETKDTDGDGTGDNADTDDDGDGVLDADDAFPLDATETKDMDADGTGDNADTDADGDGFTGSWDCNDGDASIYSGATEVCNGIDDDCDGSTDEGLAKTTYYADADGDGYGDNTKPKADCQQPAGYVTSDHLGDCNDSDATIWKTITYYTDADGDGYGTTAKSLCSTTATTGYAAVGGDCNDSDATVWERQTYYVDSLDRDGYGATEQKVCSATPPSRDYVTVGGDCAPSDASIYPGATETCNGKDDDCDGLTDEGVTTLYYYDGDGDGYGVVLRLPKKACSLPSGYTTKAGDCNDACATCYPGATEIKTDGKDNDCDGKIDEVL